MQGLKPPNSDQVYFLRLKQEFNSYLFMKNEASSSIILFQDKQTRNIAGEVKLSKLDQDKNSNYFDDFE